MGRKYYNDIYFTLGQIDNPDDLSATLFTCMKMWTDEHDVDFLPWFLQFVKDSYAVETGRDFYKDTSCNCCRSTLWSNNTHFNR